LRKAFEQRWLRLLGKYSYGLYVYHGIFAFLLAIYLPVEGLTGKLTHPHWRS
jgi:peptidoglycan/LPS O-acetylase OafA/YrhL